MTALFSARRRAEALDAAVEGRTRAVPDDLRPLVSVATALRAHGEETVAPRPEFAAELRALLMAEAERSLSPDAPLVLPQRRRGPRERRLAAAATAAVLVAGSAGVAAAAQGALPGEALYPIKRGIESAEAGLSVSTAGRGQDLLRQADGRLAEVRGLLDGSPAATPQVPGTVEDFIAQAQEGADLMLASFEETSDPQTVVAVREFAASSITVLQEIARTAPPEAQDELASAAMALKEIDARAAALCPSCGDALPELQVPGVFLAAAEVDRALALAAQRELPDNSHPVVADKRLLKRVTDLLPQFSEEQTTAEPEQQDDGAERSGPLPQDGPTSGSLLDLGGDTSTERDQTDKPVRDTLEDGTSTITDGLTGVVETLLPETELDLGLTD